MKHEILDATHEALLSISEVRFFRTERGFQGRFYCALMESFDRRGILDGETILEMEYQKSLRHGMYERPDIILHKPVEVTGAPVSQNNFAVWALKHRASAKSATEDFDKIDEMIDVLHYEVGIFVNVDGGDSFLKYYDAPYSDRLFGYTVHLENGVSNVSMSYLRPE